MIVALIVGAAVVVGVLIGHVAARPRIAELSLLMREERDRTGDLLTRLAARNPAEYALVRDAAPNAAAPVPAPPKRYISDPTGLLTLEVDDDNAVEV